jgi:hypothetical protein
MSIAKRIGEFAERYTKSMTVRQAFLTVYQSGLLLSVGEGGIGNSNSMFLALA